MARIARGLSVVALAFFASCSGSALVGSANRDGAKIEAPKEVPKQEVKEDFANLPLDASSPVPYVSIEDGLVIFTTGYFHNRSYGSTHVVVLLDRDDCSVMKSGSQVYTSLLVFGQADAQRVYAYDKRDPHGAIDAINSNHYGKVRIVTATEDDYRIWKEWLDGLKKKCRQYKCAQEEEFNKKYKKRVLPPKE